jgi:beta-lactamase regulating signal transducer with metallopeptidase domain
MIAAWMLYTIGISAVLAMAAGALEFVARTIGTPTRWVWLGAIVATLALSFGALAFRTPAPAPVSTVADTMIAVRPQLAAAAGVIVRDQTPPAISEFRSTLSRLGTRVDNAIDPLRRIDISPLERWNGILVAAWLVSVATGLLVLLGGALRMRGMLRAFAPRQVDNRPVLVSEHVGPALFGVWRPQIVVPSWVLELSAKDRRVILQHEEQHRRTYDPLLLLAGSLALVAQAWNPVLWFIAARLRLAIEMDCDRRVLASADEDVRHYGGLLVNVYQRVAVPTATLAFVTRPSNLERRIRHMTADAPRLASLGGVVAACAALVLVAVAWIAPAPAQRPTSSPTHAVDTMVAKPWPMRTSLGLVPDVCGLGDTYGQLCSRDAEVLINVVDSLHVAIALKEQGQDGKPIEHVFYVTAIDPLPTRLSRYIPSAYAEYVGGELFIADQRSTEPVALFSAGRSRTLTDRYPSAERFGQLVGISHYSADGLPFALVPFLRRSATCFNPDEVCYEAGSFKVMFP